MTRRGRLLSPPQLPLRLTTTNSPFLVLVLVVHLALNYSFSSVLPSSRPCPIDESRCLPIPLNGPQSCAMKATSLPFLDF